MNSTSSISENIFLTFRVRLRTAWFQWLWAFFSKTGSKIGRITCRLCAIKFTIWSLFHKKRALSATWNESSSENKSLKFFHQGYWVIISHNTEANTTLLQKKQLLYDNSEEKNGKSHKAFSIKKWRKVPLQNDKKDIRLHKPKPHQEVEPHHETMQITKIVEVLSINKKSSHLRNCSLSIKQTKKRCSKTFFFF